MHSLLTRENITPKPISEGEAGLILDREGGFRIFNTWKDLDAANMTPRQLEQGEILAAFAVALNIPQVMDVLKQLAADPDIVGKPIERGAEH